MKNSKHGVTRSDQGLKPESHEGLALIASLIAQHHVKNRLRVTHENQTKPRQNRDDLLFTNTQESQNIDDTDVQ